MKTIITIAALLISTAATAQVSSKSLFEVSQATSMAASLSIDSPVWQCVCMSNGSRVPVIVALDDQDASNRNEECHAMEGKLYANKANRRRSNATQINALLACEPRIISKSALATTESGEMETADYAAEISSLKVQYRQLETKLESLPAGGSGEPSAALRGLEAQVASAMSLASTAQEKAETADSRLKRLSGKLEDVDTISIQRLRNEVQQLRSDIAAIERSQPSSTSTPFNGSNSDGHGSGSSSGSSTGSKGLDRFGK